MGTSKRRSRRSSEAPRGRAPASVRAPHLVEARLRPPRGASVLLERRGLQALLERAVAGRLVLLVAPLGSGKTTLLTQWYEQASHQRAVAWLSCDEQDNDPVRFFSSLVGAIRSSVADFGAYISSRLTDRVDVPLEHVRAVFLESLGKVDRDLTIVLDDFQCILEARVVRTLSLLLHHSPANIHWVVSSRRSPDLDVGRLRLEDQLTTLGSAELNLRGEDIRDFGRRLKGLELTAEEADALCARTEGWVAGVKLAFLSAERSGSLEGFTGSNAEVVDYLASAVLKEQPPEVQAFLVTSSIVDRMSGELCGTLVGGTGGQALLERLERSQLFIQPLDSERRWYRYHAVFLDFLRSLLRRDHADRLPQLHRTASTWFATQGMYEEALHHAFAAGDRAWCGELLSRAADTWLKEGDIEAVQRWTAALSLEELSRSRTLCVAYFVSLLLSRRFPRAAADLEEAGRLITAEPDSVASRSDRLGSVRSLHFLHRVLSESADEVDVDAELPSAGGADPFMEGTLLNARAYYLLRKNRFGAARRLAMRARDVLGGTGHVYSTGYSEVVMAIADRAEGNLRAVAHSCEQAFARLKDGRRNAAWVNAATSAAYMRYEQNRLEEAERLCMQVLPLLSPASTVENFALAHVTFARVKSIRGRPAEALRLLDYLRSVLEGGGHQRFLGQACYEQVRLALAQGQAARAAAVAAEFELTRRLERGDWRVKREYEEGWERLGFTQATLLAHEGRYAEALGLLGVLHESASDVGSIYGQLPLQAALAANHWLAGDEGAAFLWLNRALALTHGSGFSRRIFDEVPALPQVLAAALERNALERALPAHYGVKFGDVLTARPGGVVQAAQGHDTGLLQPLTERELEVLRLLAQGLSNKEISSRGRITLLTTKWHLKHVFAKLGVTTRMAAVFRAQELRLLDGTPPSPFAATREGGEGPRPAARTP